MSDITTKLQSLSRWLRQLATHEPEPECNASHAECADDCVVAADEIHRLRMKVSGKDVEIAMLREALEVISHPPNITGHYHKDAVRIARAALAQVAEVPE